MYFSELFIHASQFVSLNCKSASVRSWEKPGRTHESWWHVVFSWRRLSPFCARNIFCWLRKPPWNHIQVSGKVQTWKSITKMSEELGCACLGFQASNKERNLTRLELHKCTKAKPLSPKRQVCFLKVERHCRKTTGLVLRMVKDIPQINVKGFLCGSSENQPHTTLGDGISIFKTNRWTKSWREWDFLTWVSKLSFWWGDQKNWNSACSFLSLTAQTYFSFWLYTMLQNFQCNQALRGHNP